MTAMMNFTRKPWEHFPRRKSSSSTNPRRRWSSTSTASDSTTYEPAEEQLGDSFYAASERSGTSTAVSEDRRRSANPDYDWEHDGDQDDIADLKANLQNASLWSASHDTLATTANELHKVDSSGVEDKTVGTAPPGVHEIDFVELVAPKPAVDESRSRSTTQKTLTHHQTANDIEVSHSETVKDQFSEAENVSKPAILEAKATEAADTPQLPGGAKIPVRTSSAAATAKARQLRLKITQTDKDGNRVDATSPSSPSPKSKTRPKLALDLPGIPESEAETLGRQRRPPLSVLRQAPGQPQGVHVNKSSRPPVSMKRYPVRSISAPLPGQQQPASPTEMMDLVNQRQVKFTNIREQKQRRLSSINASLGSRSSRGLMGRRHASCPVSEAPPTSPRARKPSGYPAPRPSLAQRLSLSRRKQSFSQAIKEYIRAPRRRPSLFFRRSRSVAR